jgi:rubrerythrin
MTIVVTKATGGTAKPVVGVYVPPDAQVPDAGSQTALADAGVDPTFTADLLSACLAHERCGAHLYRSVAARTLEPEFRERYRHFGAETQEHITRLEELVASAGGDPQYVSPSARATEKAGGALLESTFLLGGSIDAATAELAMLEAVLLAEAKDHDNWELLAALAEQMSECPVRDSFQSAATTVLAQEEEHYAWAQQTRARTLMILATSGAPPATTQPAPTAIETAAR